MLQDFVLALSLLQVRFGDALVGNIDVMLRDVVDSKRIAKAVRREGKRKEKVCARPCNPPPASAS